MFDELESFKVLGLSDTTLEALSLKGFSEPTDIQRECIPLLLENKLVPSPSLSPSIDTPKAANVVGNISIVVNTLFLLFTGNTLELMKALYTTLS